MWDRVHKSAELAVRRLQVKRSGSNWLSSLCGEGEEGEDTNTCDTQAHTQKGEVYVTSYQTRHTPHPATANTKSISKSASAKLIALNFW